MGYFPRSIRRTHLRFSHTGLGCRSAAENIPVRIPVSIGHIEEPGTSYIIVTGKTIRASYFKVVDEVVSPEILIGNHPASRYCREEAVTESRSEVLRACVAEIEFYKVALRIVVLYTAGPALSAVWEVCSSIACREILIIPPVEQPHHTYCMLAESPVVIYLEFIIIRSVGRIPCNLVTHGCFISDNSITVFSCIRIRAKIFLGFRLFVAGYLIVIVMVVRETAGERKTRSYKGSKVPSCPDSSLGSRPELPCIPAVGHKHIRVVPFIGCIAGTE